MAPKKHSQQKKSAQKQTAKSSQASGGAPVTEPSTTITCTTNYDELQQNEVTALQAIYGDDFVELKGSHSAWKKSEPTFEIRVRAPSDADITLTLGVVLVATYPKSPPLLTLKAHNNLKDATVFKIQKLVEDLPSQLVKEEQEMIFSIIEGIQEILQEAAEAKAAGKALPTLEEERAAHEAALIRMAQEQKEREEKKRMEETEEEDRMLQQMVQDEVKRKRDREKEARKKNRPVGVSFALPENGQGNPETETITFDQPCSLTDDRGYPITFHAVTDKEVFLRGPTTVVYEVRPVLPAGQRRPKLALKHVEVQAGAKDDEEFRRQLQTLERRLEVMKRVRHNAIHEVLDYRLDRMASFTDNGNVMSWNVFVLSPLADPGSLDTLLRFFPMDPNRARSWTVSLLDALGHLHSQGLVHQDVHLGNILLVKENRGDLVPKLADVAYQRELHTLTTAKTVTSMTDARSAYWFPPEIAAAVTPKFTEKTDIWDFGLVFLQLFLGHDVVQRYASRKSLVDSLPLSGPLEDAISRFFTDDPRKRPRAFEMSSDVFLATDVEIYAREELSSGGSNDLAPMPQFASSRSRPRGDSFSNRGFTTSRYKEDFVEEGRLGKGAFGQVVKARKKLDGQIYAIKKISQRSREGLTEVLNEVRVLSQLSHPNVVRYFNTWVEDIYDSSGAFDNSSDDESSGDESSGSGPDIEFTQSQRGLDFISDSGFVIEFEDADSEAVEDDEGDSDANEDDSSSSDEESGDEDNARTLEVPERRNERRLSHRSFKTILYISMEYCDKQCLRDLIYADLHKNETEIWRLFRQILQGLAHIHSLNVVHRDLKPDNIFISVSPDGVNNVKIGDFGLASKGQILADKSSSNMLDQGDMTTRSVGTSVYVAPEVRSGGIGNYTSKVDMYSLGITFFEMCSAPMLGMERSLKLDELRKPHPALPPDFDSASAQAFIILSLVTHNPKERPSSAALLESDRLPDEMESDTIRRAIAAITDPKSPFYGKTLSTLFSMELDLAKDYAWDMPDPRAQFPNAMDFLRRRSAKEILISIFKTHGAHEVPSPGLYPHSSHHPGAVKLLDDTGTLLQLPYDLMMGHARMLATRKDPILGPSYSFGRVFRRKQGGGQPIQSGVVDFHIVTTNALDLSLREACVLKVVDQILHTFSSLPAAQMTFQINHSDLLQIIFDACSVDLPVRRAAADTLSKLNIQDTPWSKLRTELRECGVSATSVDELQRFDFRDTPGRAFSSLKVLFEKSDKYQKAASAIAHLNEVFEFSRSLGVKTKMLLTPLHSFDEASFKGGLMFACVYEKSRRQVFAAGGRYDSLIKEHRHKAGSSSSIDRHAVGVSFAWERLAQVPARSGSKSSSRKAKEGAKSLFSEKPFDVLVASFDPIIRKSHALEVLRDLWESGISAELANDARSPDELIPDNPDEQPAWLVIVKSDFVKIKTLWTRDRPEDDIAAGELPSWIRSEMRERDSALKTTTSFARGRGGLGAPDSGSGQGDSNNFSGSHHPYLGPCNSAQQVRVLTAQTKSKKVNRQAVVDQALAAVPKLLQEFRQGPIAVVELTSDDILQSIRHTKLSEPDTWRKLDVANVERNYVKEIQGMLAQFRDGGAKDAFVYNSRGGGCIYYDLTK